MTHANLRRAAGVLLAVAVAAAIAHAAATWTRVGWEGDVPFRTWAFSVTLPFWTSAVMKVCVAVMAYGLMRTLAGGGKGVRLVWAATGVALLSILTRDLYLFAKSGFEWVVFPNTALDLAMVGIVFLLALLVIRGARPPE